MVRYGYCGLSVGLNTAAIRIRQMVTEFTEAAREKRNLFTTDHADFSDGNYPWPSVVKMDRWIRRSSKNPSSAAAHGASAPPPPPPVVPLLLDPLPEEELLLEDDEEDELDEEEEELLEEEEEELVTVSVTAALLVEPVGLVSVQ
jgi:hypothetical protein